jgi:ATP phosphoribosyltransferase
MVLLEEAGIKLSSSRRTLLVGAKSFPVEVLFLRDDDIPKAVADGVADAGIIGENELVESRQEVETVKRLGFSRCRLSLAVPKEIDYYGVSWFEGKKVATSYPGILTRFLEENSICADVHVISGSVEIAPGIGLADAIFDIVSSGNTLAVNHLREVEVVMRSEALLIANGGLHGVKRGILDELVFRIDAVRAAENKKYILLNAPNERLGDIFGILPGMRSPTVLPLAQSGWSSVHSVIDDSSFWSVIGRLKAMGAEGILVIPIEKMIL